MQSMINGRVKQFTINSLNNVQKPFHKNKFVLILRTFQLLKYFNIKMLSLRAFVLFYREKCPGRNLKPSETFCEAKSFLQLIFKGTHPFVFSITNQQISPLPLPVCSYNQHIFTTDKYRYSVQQILLLRQTNKLIFTGNEI